MERVVPALCLLVKKGHFEQFFLGIQQPNLEETMIDSTCCKAHQASAGAQK